ncbi:MAG: hypothetical protein AB7F78_13360 [Hyphomicrobiaceae bacterium]
MLLTVLGTPSPMTATVLKAVQKLAEAAFGSYHWIAAGTAEELQKAWAERGEKPVVLFADIPAQSITRMLEQSGAPVVACLEAPAVIVSHVARARKITGLPALRFASQSLGTLHDIALSPRAWRLGSGALAMPLESLIAGLVAHLGLPPDPAHQAAALRELGTRPGRPATIAGLLGDAPPPAEPGLGQTSLAGYHALLLGAPAMRFDWPAEIFLGARPHGEPLAGPISMIGGRRCIAFGPYLHLPAGRWTATVEFEVMDNVSGNALKVDIFTDRILEEVTSPLPREGRFRCAVTFTVDEPRLPLQVRLFVEEGAIEGRFVLYGVTVERAPPLAA